MSSEKQIYSVLGVNQAEVEERIPGRGNSMGEACFWIGCLVDIQSRKTRIPGN